MLSVIIITKNEASNIERCLSSVKWADEIIVLDCGSSDNTVELCKTYTDRIFVTDDWPGFGIQKQRALEHARCDWVLSIDADEQVTPELHVEIEQAIKNNQFFGFKIPRISSYCGRDITHGDWRDDFVLRLFKRKHGKFSPDLVHERVIVSGAISNLTKHLLHESFINSSEVLDKINIYSTLGAQKLHAAGKRTSIVTAIFKAVWTFFRGYILRSGFLDGRQGLMLAISNAEGTYYKYVKLLELQEIHHSRVLDHNHRTPDCHRVPNCHPRPRLREGRLRRGSSSTSKELGLDSRLRGNDRRGGGNGNY